MALKFSEILHSGIPETSQWMALLTFYIKIAISVIIYPLQGVDKLHNLKLVSLFLYGIFNVLSCTNLATINDLHNG